MRNLITMLLLVLSITSCENTDYLNLNFYIENKTSYDLELFKDYQYSATVKKNETFLWLTFDEKYDDISIDSSSINNLNSNIASVSLWKIEDNSISLAKKWRKTDKNDEPGKNIFRFSNYTMTKILQMHDYHRTTIIEEFIITITDEDIL